MNWNFGDLLDATAAVVPGDRPALILGDRVIDWASFDARTNRLARAMLASGLQTGDRVAILARNIPEFIEIASAAFKARLTHVNINYRYTTPEIDYVLADCQARAIFYQDEFAGVLGTVSDRLDHVTLAVRIGGADDEYDALVDGGDGTPLRIARSPDDGYLLYTGGTTGKPKGVMWRAGDARAAQLEAPTIKVKPRDLADHAAIVAANPAPGRVIPACPLMHGAGLNSSMAELVGGGSVVLLPGGGFNAELLWDEAARWAATRVLIVGDVFARPMAQALEAYPHRWDLSAMRVISSAGLMWSREVKQALVRALPQITLVDILGASEASGFGYAITTAERETPTGMFEIGPATVIIDPDTDRILGPDEIGEGWLARTAPFGGGYHGDPVKTAATYREIDGKLYAIPGDMAAREGHLLRLIGRGNMVINSGGEKIFAEEVEEALKRAPGIEDAIVVGLPDPKWGRTVAALIRTDAGGYREAEVQAALLAELAPYKLPRRVVVLDALPRHASGKSDYRTALDIATAAT